MYGDFVEMVDAMIGRVLTALDEQKMSEDTLLVFTSDNGPVWYEEDVKRFQHDSSGGLRGMKADAWEAGHRMPFIVRWPGKVEADSTSVQPLCFTDLMATFAEITGYELKEDEGPDSFDFSKALFGADSTQTPARTSLVMRSGSGTMTVRDGDWKLIAGLGSGGFSKPRKVKPEPNGPTGQLYNIVEDLGETKNLFSEKPEMVKQLQELMQKVVESGRHRK